LFENDPIAVHFVLFPVAFVYLIGAATVFVHSYPFFEALFVVACVFAPIGIAVYAPALALALNPGAFVKRAVFEEVDAFAVPEALIAFAHIDTVAVNVTSQAFLVSVFPSTMIDDSVLIDVSSLSISFVIFVVPHIKLSNAIVICTEPFNIAVFPLPFVSIPIFIIEGPLTLSLAQLIHSSVNFPILIVVDPFSVSLVLTPHAFVHVTVTEVVLTKPMSQSVLESTVEPPTVLVILLSWTD